MGAEAAMARFGARRREAPAPVIDHRRFGTVRASFHPESAAFLWECLDLVPTPRGLADLEFEAGAWGPTTQHEVQLDDIVANLDALSKAAARLLKATFGQTPALEWQGTRLTDRAGTFQLHFWCDTGQEQLITVSFEQSQPVRFTAHG